MSDAKETDPLRILQRAVLGAGPQTRSDNGGSYQSAREFVYCVFCGAEEQYSYERQDDLIIFRDKLKHEPDCPYLVAFGIGPVDASELKPHRLRHIEFEATE